MKIKKNTFSTLVLELFFPSIANYRKLKIQKSPKIDFPYCAVGWVGIGTGTKVPLRFITYFSKVTKINKEVF
jgi:hypothetical protein